MKKSIVNYYKAKFIDFGEISFKESFYSLPVAKQPVVNGLQKMAIAASIVLIVFSVNIIEKDFGVFQDTEINTYAQIEESTDNGEFNNQTNSQLTPESEQASGEMRNIADLVQENIDSGNYSEAKRILDNVVNNSLGGIENGTDGDKLLYWDFNVRMSLNQRDFQRALEYMENVLLIETLSENLRESYEEAVENLRTLVNRQGN